MIGILIISHGDLGNSLIHCANHVMGKKTRAPNTSWRYYPG